jgi:hypothetical protein
MVPTSSMLLSIQSEKYGLIVALIVGIVDVLKAIKVSVLFSIKTQNFAITVSRDEIHL